MNKEKICLNCKFKASTGNTLNAICCTYSGSIFDFFEHPIVDFYGVCDKWVSDRKLTKLNKNNYRVQSELKPKKPKMPSRK